MTIAGCAKQYLLELINIDELATEVATEAFGNARAGRALEDLELELGEAFKELPNELSAFLKFQALRFFQSGSTEPGAVAPQVQRATAELVEEWIRYIPYHGRWPKFAEIHAVDIPADTPRLDELTSLMVNVLPVDDAVRMRSNLVTDDLRAADVLMAGARAFDVWDLARDAFRRADADPTRGEPWISQNCPTLLDLALPSDQRRRGAQFRLGPAESVGWAAVAGRGDVASAVADRFAEISMWTSPDYERFTDPAAGLAPQLTEGAGTVAFALHITGNDGRAWAARAVESHAGWPGAGELTLAHWVLASSEPDPQLALGHLAALLGFTLEPGVEYFDTNAISIDVIANGQFDATVGPLRRGRLPRLQARAWLDVTTALQRLGRDHTAALTVARQWQQWQDHPPEGHLWDPRIYHRFTNAIRVTKQDLQSLTD